MIKKYRKRPVEIEAIQWTGENIKEVMDFLQWRNAEHDDKNGLVIITLEGRMHASITDYIIKGIAGEYYACKEDIFHGSYEESK